MNQKAQSINFGRSSKLAGSLLAAALLVGAAPTMVNAAESPAPNPVPQSQTAAKAITGTVVDETGEPMIGVSVIVQGTNNGTATDLDGNFSIKAAPNAKLTFSYVGYKPQTITVGGNSTINVKMEPDANVLDEVVAIGYGTVKRRDLTGAVSSVSDKEILLAPTNNAMQALQGRVSGLDITQESGQVGAAPEVQLRGQRSIYASSKPLYIIDGLPGDYESLNPADIETIDVMKDASSTAIYGSAGANGVIIITTKRGSEGKPRVNFDAYWGFSGSPNFKHGMTGDEWTAYQRESYKYINGQYPSSMDLILTLPSYQDLYNEGAWIDWADQLAGNTATQQKYSLSVSGGSKSTRVYASAAYSQQKGLLENDNRNSYNLNLNLDQDIFDWATIGFTTNIDYYAGNSTPGGAFSKSISAFPLGHVRNAEGELVNEYAEQQYTPLGDLLPGQYENNTKSTNTRAQGYLEIRPVKGLSFRSQISTNLSNSRNGRYYGLGAQSQPYSWFPVPSALKVENNGWSYTWENILNYNLNIKQHSIGVTGVTSWSKNTSESTTAGSANIPMDSFKFHNLLAGDSQRAESGYTQTQKMSYAVRLNYSWAGRYLFTFSNRWDGVSWFTEGHKWDAFPAVALAWRISEEPFMEPTRDWLGNLKLRVGYGVTGNSGLSGQNAYVTTTQTQIYPSGVTVMDGIPQITQYTGTFGVADLTWEKSYNWNAGIDFTLLHNRIDGSIEYYHTQTKGLLFSRTMPITTGMTGWGSPLSSWQNLAETKNEGVEITINTHNITTKDFEWNSAITATWNREEIVSLPDGDIVASSLFEGYPIKSIYGYKYEGLWKTSDNADEMTAYGVEPGFVKLQTVPKVLNEETGETDLGVHAYGDDDRMILGHRNPTWVVGFNNNFRYKDFDLSLFMMGRFGQTIQSDLIGYYDAKSSATTNQLAGVDYWTEGNEDVYYPRPGTGDRQTRGMEALRVVSGSFWKIKNITLGYTLPKKITQMAKIDRLRVYFTAYNPWIICHESLLNGTDPEQGGSAKFPTYKQFVFGLNLTF